MQIPFLFYWDIHLTWSLATNRMFYQYKATSSQASAHIKRWSLILSAYEYKIVFLEVQSNMAMQMPNKQIAIIHHASRSPYGTRASSLARPFG